MEDSPKLSLLTVSIQTSQLNLNMSLVQLFFVAQKRGTNGPAKRFVSVRTLII